MEKKELTFEELIEEVKPIFDKQPDQPLYLAILKKASKFLPKKLDFEDFKKELKPIFDSLKDPQGFLEYIKDHEKSRELFLKSNTPKIACIPYGDEDYDDLDDLDENDLDGFNGLDEDQMCVLEEELTDPGLKEELRRSSIYEWANKKIAFHFYYKTTQKIVILELINNLNLVRNTIEYSLKDVSEKNNTDYILIPLIRKIKEFTKYPKKEVMYHHDDILENVIMMDKLNSLIFFLEEDGLKNEGITQKITNTINEIKEVLLKKLGIEQADLDRIFNKEVLT